jgi:predicted transcriptional regulator
MIPPIPSPVRDEVVRLRRDEHLLQREISTRLAVSPAAVSKILARAGLGRRKPPYLQCALCGGHGA